MTSRVTYRLSDGVAQITLDDGKANALSFEIFSDLLIALDRAAADEAAVVLAGRPGRFSAGFDLNVLMGEPEAAVDLVRTGFETARRLLSYPRPVVAACTGHAIAMGLFLVQSADFRVGAAGGSHKLVANEVAIGLTMPRAALAICRYRLDSSHFERVVLQAETLDPAAAVSAGLLDVTIDGDEVVEAARRKAAELSKLDTAAYAATKLRARSELLAELGAAIRADAAELKERASAPAAK